MAIPSLAGHAADLGRGASGGKTSWSGKPEAADYQSFAGLFIHYLSHIRPHPPPDSQFLPDQLPVSPTDVVQTDSSRYVASGRTSDAVPSVIILPVPWLILYVSA